MDFFKKVFNTVGSVIGFGPAAYDDQDGAYEEYDERSYDNGAYADGDYEDGGYDNGTYRGGYADGQGDYEYEEPRAQDPSRARRRSSAGAQQYEQEENANVFAGRRSAPRDNVVQMNAERRTQKIRVENLMPEVSNEAQMNKACEMMIDRMLQGEIVIISTVNVDDKQRSRMVLMLSGASFAVKARFSHINAMTYIMVPDGIELSMESERPRNTNAFFSSSDFFGGVR